MNHRTKNTTRRWIHPTYDTELQWNGRTVKSRTFSQEDLAKLLFLCEVYGPAIAAAEMSKKGRPNVPVPLACHFAKEAGITFWEPPAHF